MKRPNKRKKVAAINSTQRASTANHALLLAFLCTFLTASAQVLMKFGTQNLALSINGILLNTPLMLSLVVYAIGSVLMITALRSGELSVVFPVLATSYVWVTFLSSYFFNEHISMLKLLGVGSIILGVSFIGIGGKR